MKTIIFATLFVVIATTGYAGDNAIPSRETREVELADTGILTSLMIARNPKSQHLCTTVPYACLGPRKSDLSLALIGARNSSISFRALANVLQYKIDGALSEDFECYALNKGRVFVKFLKKLEPASLEASCRLRVEEIIRINNELFGGFEPSLVCANSDQIETTRRDLLEALNHGTSCGPEDF